MGIDFLSTEAYEDLTPFEKQAYRMLFGNWPGLQDLFKEKKIVFEIEFIGEIGLKVVARRLHDEPVGVDGIEIPKTTRSYDEV